LKYSKTEKVRVEVLRRFGDYCTESNGHLSEYLPRYRKRTKEIPEWIDLSSWINGETGGYLRICTEGRNWFETVRRLKARQPQRVDVCVKFSKRKDQVRVWEKVRLIHKRSGRARLRQPEPRRGRAPALAPSQSNLLDRLI
jgi:hypothetical protein